MLLAIDIGNTSISFGFFCGDKLIKRQNIPTREYSFDKLKRILNRSEINDSIICSVVPKVARILSKDLKILLNCQPYILGKNLIVPIKNLYRKPKQVGQDRLVNAYAGIALFGAPLIAVDFGTALTFDVISRQKEYLGGMIFPGLSMSLEALTQKTALLPSVSLDQPKEFIGRDTKNSMLSGIVYGFAALTDDLVGKIKNKIGKNAKVVGTGGNVDFIAKHCKNIDVKDVNLTLKGIDLIYNNRLV